MGHLAQHLNVWQLDRAKYANAIPQDDLVEMWLEIIPEELAAKVDEECGTYEGALRFIDFKISKLKDKRKTQADQASWAKSMKGNTKTPYVAVIEEGPAQPPPPPPSLTAEQVGNMVNAALARRRDPRSKGRGSPRASSPSRKPRRFIHPDWPRGTRFECGEKGHPLRSCQTRDASIKQHGKLPENHNTAYDNGVQKKTAQETTTSNLFCVHPRWFCKGCRR